MFLLFLLLLIRNSAQCTGIDMLISQFVYNITRNQLPLYVFEIIIMSIVVIHSKVYVSISIEDLLNTITLFASTLHSAQKYLNYSVTRDMNAKLNSSSYFFDYYIIVYIQHCTLYTIYLYICNNKVTQFLMLRNFIHVTLLYRFRKLYRFSFLALIAH